MQEDYKQYNYVNGDKMKRSTKITTAILTLIMAVLVLFNVISKEDADAANNTVQGIDSILVETDTTNAVTLKAEAVKDSIE